MSCKEVFKIINELYPEYVRVWEDVCNIESPTNYKEGVDKVCRYFTDIAIKQGWNVEISKQEISGKAACITMNGDIDKAPICFSGHMDTVHPVGLFPIPLVKKDEKNIYGPGVIDCMGGCVSSFLAMDALMQAGYKKRPIKLILQSDEETGSKTSGKKTVEFMCEKAKGAVAFFNTEPHETGKATLQRKGILRFRINITGKAAHSSMCYEGANAVAEAAYKIIELEKMKNPDGLTCNCGVIEGGTVANTVAEKCSFLVDIRFSNEQEKENSIKILNKVVEKSWIKGCKSELEQVSYRPAMEYSPKNYLLLERLNKIYKQNALPILEPVSNNGGSDAAYITQCGIPCIDGIGTIGAGMHSLNEYSELNSLIISAQYLAAAALYL